MRELDNRFYEACNTTALLSLEKYGLDGADLDALPEEARVLLQDKDSLLNAVQVRCQTGLVSALHCQRCVCFVPHKGVTLELMASFITAMAAVLVTGLA